MSPGTSDRNLLAGMLAFQNGFVRREQLLAAMNAWLLDKGTPLEDILLGQGALNFDQKQLLVALVRQHLAMHHNVAERSLAAISSLGSVREELRSLADPDLNASLVHVAAGNGADRFETVPPTRNQRRLRRPVPDGLPLSLGARSKAESPMDTGTRSPPIDWRRVILGGLIAGLILLLVQMVFHWIILGANWWFFRALTEPLARAAGIVRYTGLHFIIGLTAVWLYAAARPRYGPGPKTAVRIGLAYWVIGDAVPTLSFYPLLASEIRGPMWLTAGVVDLLGVTLATLCGAWFYSEGLPEPKEPPKNNFGILAFYCSTV